MDEGCNEVKMNRTTGARRVTRRIASERVRRVMSVHLRGEETAGCVCRYDQIDSAADNSTQASAKIAGVEKLSSME
jgi:hypothetical protein